jgi:Lrp/AsnC family transcriptional regulator for asnA, asnC and gidA
MMSKEELLDELDKAILRELQNDCRTRLQEIADKVGANASSTIHYRIKRLEKAGIIDGYYAHIDPLKIHLDFVTVTHIKAKSGMRYHKQIGKELAKVPGVWAVYITLGDWDLVILTRSQDRAAYMTILDNIMEIRMIERSSTMVVAETIDEEHRLEI